MTVTTPVKEDIFAGQIQNHSRLIERKAKVRQILSNPSPETKQEISAEYEDILSKGLQRQ
jgi:hypothetical protein